MRAKTPSKTVVIIIAISVFAVILSMLIGMLIAKNMKKTELFHAIQISDYDTVCELIDENPDFINEYRYVPGFIASMTESVNTTPLGSACMYDCYEIVAFLVSHGADINKCSNNLRVYPLISALDRGYTDVACYLIENGADVTVTNRHGKTVMQYADELKNEKLNTLLEERIK